MPTVVLLGTLDTKGEEYDWMRARIISSGLDVHVVDVGVAGAARGRFDTSRHTVAEAAGTSIRSLLEADDRGRALHAMAEGAAAVVDGLRAAGMIHGILAVAGSGGSSIAAHVMQTLPIGFPKLLVSTMASGDVSPYVGATDVAMMYSVVDISGINRVSRAVLGNAVAAVVGMASEFARPAIAAEDRPLVAASMFGVTTPAVEACRVRLEKAGYEVLVFHATGSGGRALEALAAGGYLEGVLDLTTTELADELVGGVLTAGPDRVTAAGEAAVPQVISVGALDMVNFGPRETVPAGFEDRVFYEHNDTVTLMRTTTAESRELGRVLGEKVAGARGPTVVILPHRGVSALDAEGALFWDPEADSALFDALRARLAHSRVRVIDIDAHINDEDFAIAASDALLEIMRQNRKTP